MDDCTSRNQRIKNNHNAGLLQEYRGQQLLQDRRKPSQRRQRKDGQQLLQEYRGQQLLQDRRRRQQAGQRPQQKDGRRRGHQARRASQE